MDDSSHLVLRTKLASCATLPLSLPICGSSGSSENTLLIAFCIIRQPGREC